MFPVLEAGLGDDLNLDKPAKHKVGWRMDEIVRKYMAEIGRKGGKANKGKAKKKCQLAAKARWEKYRAQQLEDEEGVSTDE